MPVKKKTIKELNEELESLVTKVKGLEEFIKDLAVKLNKKIENHEKIDEIKEK